MVRRDRGPRLCLEMGHLVRYRAARRKQVESSLPHIVDNADRLSVATDARDELIAKLMPGLAVDASANAAEGRRVDVPSPAHFVVECVEASALVAHHAAWEDLCRRAVEPNIFLEPAFAAPLFQHMPRMLRPRVLLVWEENGATSFGRLLGLFPVSRSAGFAVDGTMRGFVHEQVSCGVPLLDRDHAVATFDAVLTWLADRTRGVDALALAALPRDGAFRTVVEKTCQLTRRRLVTAEAHERAILRHPAPGIAVCHASAKRRKERARQRRRLSEKGSRTYVSAQTPTDIATAAERFLALEHNGWKGGRGTALLSSPSTATFFRTMTRLMAHEGKCRIDSIEIDGRPVAMGVVIAAGARAYFWKTAFDETFAALSPGVQLAIELTGAQLADRTIASTDSCAIANHPMIDKLWPERLEVEDLIVEIRPRASWPFDRSVLVDRLWRLARRHAKKIRRRFRRHD